MSPLNRRGFLATCAGVALAGLVVAPAVADAADKDYGLTERIVASLERRNQLGQNSGVIFVSDEGHATVQREHGYEPSSKIRWSLRGVPCVRSEHCVGREYVIGEVMPRGVVWR